MAIAFVLKDAARKIYRGMHAEAASVVAADLTLLAAHEIAADAEHQLTTVSLG